MASGNAELRSGYAIGKTSVAFKIIAHSAFCGFLLVSSKIRSKRVADLPRGVLKIDHQTLAAGIVQQVGKLGKFGVILGEQVPGGGIHQSQPAFDGPKQPVAGVEQFIIILRNQAARMQSFNAAKVFGSRSSGLFRPC